MFKYIMLCVGLMLALPSYAADMILNAGTEDVQCQYFDRYNVTPIVLSGVNRLPSDEKVTGDITLVVNGVQLQASADNPGLTGLTAQGDKFDCPIIAGFERGSYNLLNLPSNLDSQVGTFKITRTQWYADGYFDIGNGLAMKIVAGDNRGQQLSPSQGSPSIETYRGSNRSYKQLGLKLQATLKVVDKVEANRTTVVNIGIFDYTISKGSDYQTARVPVSVSVEVKDALFRSCEVSLRNLDLAPALKHELDEGEELSGGELMVGPVICDPGVDVKVSFFDQHNTDGLVDYLRTVYYDNADLSQYVLRVYPEGSNQPVKFLPVNMMQEGWGASVNETTINFTANTTSATNNNIVKNYRVNYVKVIGIGDDRPGEIRGLMTMQFLYY